MHETTSKRVSLVIANSTTIDDVEEVKDAKEAADLEEDSVNLTVFARRF